MTSWALQDAKGRFSEVVEKARSEGPQLVTKRGEGSVVIMAIEKFIQLTRREGKDDLVSFFKHSPLAELNSKWLERDHDIGRDVQL